MARRFEAVGKPVTREPRYDHFELDVAAIEFL